MKPHRKPAPPPELSIYRRKTVAMLRRYFNQSVELGRLPSILGRELLPSSNVHCRPVSFEGFVVFVLDVEHCLQRLRRIDQQLITRVILQEYSQEQAARLLGWPVIKVERRLPEVLDLLSEIFLSSGLMKPYPQQEAVEIDAERSSASAEETALVDSIMAVSESDVAVQDVALQDTECGDDFRRVPVEIFLSSPPDVTNPRNCVVQ